MAEYTAFAVPKDKANRRYEFVVISNAVSHYSGYFSGFSSPSVQFIDSVDWTSGKPEVKLIKRHWYMWKMAVSVNVHIELCDSCVIPIVMLDIVFTVLHWLSSCFD